MQIEKVSHWLTVIGNMGLLIGVTLVVFQINQNSALVREQLDHAVWTDDLNLHLAMMGENPAAAVAKAIENPSALSVEDARVVDAYYLYWALAQSRKILMYERGMSINPPYDYEPDSLLIELWKRPLGNAYAKARFEETRMGPDMTPRVRNLMDSFSGDESLNEYERIMGRIKERQ